MLEVNPDVEEPNPKPELEDAPPDMAASGENPTEALFAKRLTPLLGPLESKELVSPVAWLLLVALFGLRRFPESEVPVEPLRTREQLVTDARFTPTLWTLPPVCGDSIIIPPPTYIPT